MKPEHAEAVIELVQKIQESFETTMTPEELAAREKRARDDDASGAFVYSANQSAQAFDDFATQSAIDALETMADEIHTVIEKRMEKLRAQALEVYYALEDLLAKDPGNEEYLHHMEEMQRAHQSQYGKPIPPRARHTE